MHLERWVIHQSGYILCMADLMGRRSLVCASDGHQREGVHRHTGASLQEIALSSQRICHMCTVQDNLVNSIMHDAQQTAFNVAVE